MSIIGNTLYVSGGVGPDDKADVLVQVYDTNTATWSTLPPSPIRNSECTVINDQLTLIGGRNSATKEVTNEVWSWDEEKMEWEKTIPPMPTERVRPALVKSGNVVAVIGGMTTGEQVALDTVDILDTKNLEWTQPNLLKLPFPVYRMNAGTCDTYAYIAGGRNGSNQSIKTVLKIPLDVLEQSVAKKQVQNDLKSCEWVEVPSEIPSSSSGMLPTSRYPLVVGGRINSENTSIISVFDSNVNKWFNVGNYSIACCRPCLVSVSHSAFIVIGGYTHPVNYKESSLKYFELYYF